MERDAGGRNFRIMSRARFLEVWRGAGAEFRIGMWLVMLGTLGAVSAAVLLAMGSVWSGLLVGVLALVVAVIGNFLRVQAFKRYLSR
jgi:O-antigen/teichoic acid export membrane protein